MGNKLKALKIKNVPALDQDRLDRFSIFCSLILIFSFLTSSVILKFKVTYTLKIWKYLNFILRSMEVFGGFFYTILFQNLDFPPKV